METQEYLLTRSKEFVSVTLKPMAASFDYHNLAHAERVVKAAKLIGRASRLNVEQLNIVMIAAWFHDVDYYNGSVGHEERSALIAITMLAEWGASINLARGVSRAILATRTPQNPGNIAEMVLCDADLAHLGSPKYEAHASRLRCEWEVTRGFKLESDQAWCRFNLAFLKNHHYFTDYGKTILERRKITNMDKMLRQLKLNTCNRITKPTETL